MTRWRKIFLGFGLTLIALFVLVFVYTHAFVPLKFRTVRDDDILRANSKGRAWPPLFGAGLDWQEAATYLKEVAAFTGRKAKLGKPVRVEMDEDRNIERVLLVQQVAKPKGDDRKPY